MLKRIITFIIVALLVLGSALGLSLSLYEVQSASLSLVGVFAFHIVSASIIYILVELTYQQLPNQAGFAYLASVFVKAGFFMLMYKEMLFGEDSLVQADRVMLIVPLTLGLLLEGIFLAKLLKLSLSPEE